jgi:hypothetical protein
MIALDGFSTFAAFFALAFGSGSHKMLISDVRLINFRQKKFSFIRRHTQKVLSRFVSLSLELR